MCFVYMYMQSVAQLFGGREQLYGTQNFPTADVIRNGLMPEVANLTSFAGNLNDLFSINDI